MAKTKPTPTTNERCPWCNAHLAIAATPLTRDGETVAKLGPWTHVPCPQCERSKTMPFKMAAGLSWKDPRGPVSNWMTYQVEELHDADMELVEVPAKVAETAVYKGLGHWDADWRERWLAKRNGEVAKLIKKHGTETFPARACICFWSPETKEVYFQIQPKEEP